MRAKHCNRMQLHNALNHSLNLKKRNCVQAYKKWMCEHEQESPTENTAWNLIKSNEKGVSNVSVIMGSAKQCAKWISVSVCKWNALPNGKHVVWKLTILSVFGLFFFFCTQTNEMWVIGMSACVNVIVVRCGVGTRALSCLVNGFRFDIRFDSYCPAMWLSQSEILWVSAYFSHWLHRHPIQTIK